MSTEQNIPQSDSSAEPDPLASDPGHCLEAHFFHELLREKEKGKIVEVGSRARSGITRRHLIPDSLEYVGFDIREGPNVDVVGDAHQMSKFFRKGSIDFIFSMSVFEHLAMPWKVAIETNKVLRKGGIAMHVSHQAWPLHEVPWDYWRYSDEAWKSLFNVKTGFEIISAKMGEPAHLHPYHLHEAVKDVHKFPQYMKSVVVCRKIKNTRLKWNVSLSEITGTKYPH